MIVLNQKGQKMKKLHVALFTQILVQEFELVCPIKIIFKNNIILDGQECFGIYEGKNGFHTITIDATISKIPECLFAIMAHEFVHAWQNENNLKKNWAKNMHNSKLGFTQWKKYFKHFYAVNIVTMLPNGLTLNKMLAS